MFIVFKLEAATIKIAATDPYQLRSLRQSYSWLNGKPYHNYKDGECCFDFSCCHPDIYTKDYEKRLKRVNRHRENYDLGEHYVGG